jgi:hypothetical protein
MASLQPRFISCEDSLPHYLGLYNPVATITAAAMMAVPVTKVRRAFLEDRPLPLKLHTFSLLALFAGNLFSHARGMSDNQIFDRLPSWYGISGAYCLWRVDAGLVPVLVMWFLVQLLLMHKFQWTNEQQFYLPIEGLTNLYIIFTMGRRSWSNPRRRNQFFRCLACFGGVHAVTTLEPHVCTGPVLLARLYHAIFDHSLISLLFCQVTGLMFDLVGTKSDKKLL